MLKNYFRVALRNLGRDRTSSIINLGGLSVGMAVAMLIGFWVYSELTFNKSFDHYDRIAMVMQHQTSNGQVNTFWGMPKPLGQELKENYGTNFKYVVRAGFPYDGFLSSGSKNLSTRGTYMDPDAPSMLSLQMQKGNLDGLKDPHSIILSASTAKAFFGDQDPLGKSMRIGNKLDVKVTGVYADLPHSVSFSDMGFFAPWDLYTNSETWIRNSDAQWDNNSFLLYVQIADNTDFKTVDQHIIHVKYFHSTAEDKKANPELFLHPMSDWYLRSHWENGVKTGGPIVYVRLFILIGAFVLLLACINFMNLSTARSEKRAKEVGIRKTIGSRRGQLVAQFYVESLLMSLAAFGIAVLLVQLILPWFNEVAGKTMTFPWSNPLFWLVGLTFTALTGVIAGSYPALYLSAFRPIKVLKGTFNAGRLAGLPRKVLVVVQFSISIALIIATVVVYNQIQYSKNRPIGYDNKGLIMIRMTSPDFYGKFGVLESELKSTGAATSFAESSSPLTDIYQTSNGFTWPGKDPNLDGSFATIWVTHDYGKTLGWTCVDGRDFSKDFPSDSSAVLVNEAAVHFMGIKNPVGSTIRWAPEDGGKKLTVIGVMKDMQMESPYEAIRPTLYFMDYENVNWIILRLNPERPARESIAKAGEIFHKIVPAAPFDYHFADKDYALKFASEERIGKLSSFFAALAIFISCLGLFGLASFIAEQRRKELGIRKVLGATMFQLWGLQSRSFLTLILVSLVIATPTAYFLMHRWLLNYTYRTGISGWVFGLTGLGVVLLALCTVSIQAIKASLTNPVKSLRTE